MVLDGGPRSASVVTLEPSTFAVVSRAELRDYVVQHPDFAVFLISRLIKRTRNATNNIKTLALMDVYGRVARLLLSLADDVEGKLVVRDKLTQQDIADRVGASREMVARILKDLAIGDYIASEGKNIIINGKLPTSY